MTKKQVIEAVKDHIDLASLRTVKYANGTYRVFAECSDGEVEIKPSCQPRRLNHHTAGRQKQQVVNNKK